jgi:hypothetical protein
MTFVNRNQTMKKLINRAVDVVPEMLAGLVARSPGLTLLEDYPQLLPRCSRRPCGR